MLQMKKVALALVLGSALAAHAEDIKVGIALDISGPFSALGAEARDGFDLAIDKLGGKLGASPRSFSRPTSAAARSRPISSLRVICSVRT